MAEQLFNRYADIPALEAEKQKILGYFTEIKAGIVELNHLGVKIDASKSIAETTRAAKELQTVQTQSIEVQTKIDASVEKSRLLRAKADEATAKAQLQELKLREANIAAIDREAKAKARQQETGTTLIGGRPGITNATQDITVNDDDGYNRKLLMDMNARLAAQKELLELELAEQEARKATYEGGVQYTDEEIQAAKAQNDAYAERLNNTKREAAANTELKQKVDGLNVAITELTGNDRVQAEQLLASIQAQIVAETELTQNKRLQKELQAAASGNPNAMQLEQLSKLRLEEGVLTAEAKELNFTVQQQTKLFNAEAGSIQALQAQYELAAQKYRLMSAEMKGSDEGQALLKNIQTLSPALKNAEAEIGKSQRNVGNYGSAVTGFFSKAFSGLRQLAYLIPGIGMAGLLNLAIEGISAGAEAIINYFTKAEGGAKKAREAISDTMDKTSDDIGKQVGELQALYAVSQDTTVALNQRKDATERILEINDKNNKSTGESNALLTDSNGILKQNKSAIDDLTESLVRQAKTKAYLNLIEEAFGQLVKAQNIDLDKSTGFLRNTFNALRGEMGAIAASPINLFNIPGVIKQGEQSVFIGAKKAKESGVKDAQDYYDNLIKSLKIGLSNKSLSLDGIFGDTTGKGSKAEQYQRDLKAIFDLQKLALEQEIEYQKAVANDAYIATHVRVDARQKQADAEHQLTQLETDYELGVIKQKEAKEIEAAKNSIKNRKQLAAALAIIAANAADQEALVMAKSKLTNVDTDTKRIEDSIKIRVNAFKEVNLEAAALEDDYNKKVIKDIEEQRAYRMKAMADEFAMRLQGVGDKADQAIDAETEALKNKTGLYANATTAYTNYEGRVAAIQKDAEKERLQAQLDYYIELSLQMDLSTDKQKEAAKGIYDTEKKFRDLALKDEQEAEKTKQELHRQTGQAYKQLGQQLLVTVNSLLDGSVDAEKNRVQKQIDQIDVVTAAQINQVNATTASEQDKAARIAIIQAKAQSDKEALDRRQRQLDHKKAMYDREFAAFNIITSTIESVAKIKLSIAELIASPNPLIKALIPIAAAQIPIAIGVGAAQLVATLATPLPAYYTGTEGAKEGLAKTAEYGRELALEPGGKVKLYDHPAIRYVKGGTKIFSNDVTESIFAAAEKDRVRMMNNYTSTTTLDDSRIVGELKQLNKRSRITIINNTPVESTAWYNQQMKN